MPCYKLVIAYDGTRYGGWQKQPNCLSIQQELQEALCKIIQQKEVHVTGAGRTDAGVHAHGQVAHFKMDNLHDPNLLYLGLNGLLPSDIRIRSVQIAEEGFHARYSAISKEYHYNLYLERVMDPFRRLYCWHCLRAVDISLLKEAATLFVGTHNFSAFANNAAYGCAANDPVRTIYSLDIVPMEGGFCLQFKGDGFLYKMVRNIVGTLVDVACSKIKLAEIKTIFASQKRSKGGQTAPPQGLFLRQVNY